MKKSQEFELRKRIGDLNAVCGWKEYAYTDGPADGLRAVDFKNGRNLEMTVVTGKSFDIPYMSYKGVNVGFISKVGVRSPYLYREEGGRGFLKQFSAGLLTTCGITYAGGAGFDGRDLGLHGPLANIPAEQVSVREAYEGDDKVFKLEGTSREACVFEENVVLKRSMTVETERDVIRIHDVAENQGFATTPVMLIYHINFGYPMLDDGAKVYSNARKISPRNEEAEKGIKLYDLIEEPTVGRDEQCYIHEQFDPDGFAMLHNEKLGMAAIVHFNAATLPIFCEWKCMRAGEYVLGLEPTTSGVLNRSDARRDGTLTFLEPGEERTYDVSIEMTDDPAVIAAYKAKATNPKF